MFKCLKNRYMKKIQNYVLSRIKLQYFNPLGIGALRITSDDFFNERNILLSICIN